MGGGGKTEGGEAEGLGMHGLGATAGLALFRVAGEEWETVEGWVKRPGLGAIGGGEGLVVAGSLGLGANGGFFTPAHKEGEVIYTADIYHLPTMLFFFFNEAYSKRKAHDSMLQPCLPQYKSRQLRDGRLESKGQSQGHSGLLQPKLGVGAMH